MEDYKDHDQVAERPRSVLQALQITQVDNGFHLIATVRTPDLSPLTGGHQPGVRYLNEVYSDHDTLLQRIATLISSVGDADVGGPIA